MLFFSDLFSASRKTIPFKDFLKEKTRLERLKHYYQDKIAYLSSPKIPPSLATIVCRDVPRHVTKGQKANGRKHLKICLKYYKKRLLEVGRELKKFS